MSAIVGIYENNAFDCDDRSQSFRPPQRNKRLASSRSGNRFPNAPLKTDHEYSPLRGIRCQGIASAEGFFVEPIALLAKAEPTLKEVALETFSAVPANSSGFFVYATDHKDKAQLARRQRQVLQETKKWHGQQKIDRPDAHQHVWYRGHSDATYVLWPGVYRESFTTASLTIYGHDAEERRLNLEREMLNEFRISGATLLDASAIVWVYFIAQHYGVPTRLLDWTTNALRGRRQLP
jgi:hypothetical protein